MTLEHKDALDVYGRCVPGVWRYDLLFSDFTAAAQTETLTLNPLIATGASMSGGGAIITDAFVLIEAQFASPNVVRIVCDVGDATNGSDAYLDAVEIHAAGHGSVGLKGDTPNEKGDRLVGATASDSGGTMFLDENVAITVTVDTSASGADNVDDMTAGQLTICIVYYEIPQRLE